MSENENPVSEVKQIIENIKSSLQKSRSVDNNEKDILNNVKKIFEEYITNLANLIRQFMEEDPEKTSSLEFIYVNLLNIHELAYGVARSKGFSAKDHQDLMMDSSEGGFGEMVHNLSMFFDKLSVPPSEEQPDFVPTIPAKSFIDLKGSKDFKKNISSSYINPVLYPALLNGAGGNILMFGPPGTGKSFSAEALAGECAKVLKQAGRHTSESLFLAVDHGKLLGQYYGQTEKQIEALFKQCRDKLERNSSVAQVFLFIDEFDSLVPRRNDQNASSFKSSVSTFLQQMDGVNSNDRIKVIGATNYIDHIDPAILSRFGTKILMDLPSEEDAADLIMDEVLKTFENNLRLAEYSKASEFRHEYEKKTYSISPGQFFREYTHLPVIEYEDGIKMVSNHNEELTKLCRKMFEFKQKIRTETETALKNTNNTNKTDEDIADELEKKLRSQNQIMKIVSHRTIKNMVKQAFSDLSLHICSEMTGRKCDIDVDEMLENNNFFQKLKDKSGDIMLYKHGKEKSELASNSSSNINYFQKGKNKAAKSKSSKNKKKSDKKEHVKNEALDSKKIDMSKKLINMDLPMKYLTDAYAKIQTSNIELQEYIQAVIGDVRLAIAKDQTA